MYINTPDRLDRKSIDTQSESPATFNDSSDINFFNAQLSSPPESSKKMTPSASGNLLNLNVPESAAGLVKRGLRDKLQNKTTKESYALPEALARANLEVVAPVKVLGMLVKGVDKISNLA